MEKLKVLITAGPTREFIDPVRYISNESSGRMGTEVALECEKRGYDVCVVLGPVCREISAMLSKTSGKGNLQVIDVVSAEDMFNAVNTEIKKNKPDIFISAAAIADFTADKKSGKIKSGDNLTSINLKPVKKITLYVKKNFPGIFAAGFKAEHDVKKEQLISAARKKLVSENLDLMFANDIKDKIGSDENEIFAVKKTGDVIHLARDLKKNIAVKLVDIIILEIDSLTATI